MNRVELDRHSYRRSLVETCFVLAAVLAVSGEVGLLAGNFPHTAKVAAIESLTHDTKRVRFSLLPEDTLRFAAGQYVLLNVSNDFLREWNARYKTSYEEISRPYSFASSPSQLPCFDLIVKLAGPPPGKDVPPGVGSTYVHQLKIGDSAQFSEPMGELSASPDTGRPIIIVAGGTGAAPFLSWFQSWFDHSLDHKSQVFFFYGVRSRRDLFLHSQFQCWADRRKDFIYVPALSSPEASDEWNGETGFINAVVDKHISAPSEADAYLAGPPVMLREVKKVLLTKGITQERIHYDPITVR